jgi:UDP-N-acetylmuramoyl-L-alanyl-D-glutamate--2,6-diaminopimelate ligase
MIGVTTRPTTVIEPDRRKAIHLAVQLSSPKDIILVAGRGLEEFQDIAGERIPLRDDLVVQEALAALS